MMTRRSAHVKMTKGRKSQIAHLPFLLAPAMPRNIADNKEKISQFKTETLLNQKSLLYPEIIQIKIKSCADLSFFQLKIVTWMETFTRSKTSISTASICLLAISNLVLVFGGVCWICLCIFRREVCVRMSKCTHGGWVPMLCQRTQMLLWLLRSRELVPNTAVWWLILFLILRLWKLSVGGFIILGIFPALCMSSGRTVPALAHSCILHLLLHFHPDPPSAERFFYRGKKTCGPWKLQGHRLIREHCSMGMSIKAQHFLLHIGQNQMT